MYAVFTAGGKQYKVSEGDTLYIEKINAEAGATVKFEEILLIEDNGNVTVGNPFVKGAYIEATLDKNGKGKKVRVFKFKAKKGYRKRIGHRQPYSKITVKTIKA